MAKQIHQLTTASSVGTSDYLAKDTGSVTNKVTTSQIANFVVGTYTTLVAGATQTIKAAINAIKSQLNTLQNHTGLTSISGSGKSTISELLGNTSISSIGGGTVTGALNSLSSDVSSLNDSLSQSVGGVATYVSNAQFENANGIRYEMRHSTLFITINMSRQSGAPSLTDFVEIANIPYQIDNNGTNNAFYSGFFANTTTAYQLRFRPASGTTHIDFVSASTSSGFVRATFAFALV